MLSVCCQFAYAGNVFFLRILCQLEISIQLSLLFGRCMRFLCCSCTCNLLKLCSSPALRTLDFFNCDYTQRSKLLSLMLCSSKCCRRMRSSDGANCCCKPAPPLWGAGLEYLSCENLLPSQVKLWWCLGVALVAITAVSASYGNHDL